MPRYLYGMRHLRGFGPGCQPGKGLISREDDPAGRYNDVLVYDRELEPHEIDTYELDFMGVEPDTATDGSNTVKKGGNDEDRTSGDCISRQAMLDGIDKLIKIHFDRTVVLYKARKVAEDLPSAQPEPAIPLSWIEGQIKWLKSMDNAFATLSAEQISALVNKWKDEQDG